MFLKYMVEMVKLTRAHIGIAVLPSFWLGFLFALLLGYQFDVFVFVMGFAIIFLMYSSASYVNDYYDFEADKHNHQFGFSGGSGVLQKYPNLKKPTLYGAFIFIVIALLLTAYLVIASLLPWWALFYIGLGAFFSWFYSAPPIRLCYRGVGEVPHFIAGLMNAGWGYMLLTRTIDWALVVFAIPLALHLLCVILLFEIPDREADIHGGKNNYIVKYGRLKSFPVITAVFWLTTLYFLILDLSGWLSEQIDFLLLAVLSVFPSLVSTVFSINRTEQKTKATRFAIFSALSLFLFSIVVLAYFIYLLV